MKAHLRIALGWLIVAALLFRGLIPVGYMPDSTKTAGLFPAIRICGGHMSAPGKDSKAKIDITCPFSINAAFSLADGGGHGFPIALIVFVTLIFLPAALVLAPQRVYGNASSRAPPRFS